VPRGVRAGTDAGRTRAAEGHGRRLIFCTRNRTDPISGFANNGDAPGISPKIGFISPGCPKATVDSKRILTRLRTEGYGLVPSYQEADLVVVNTCGFIEAAVDESLAAIDEALSEHGRVIVTGCLGARAERVRETYPRVLTVTGPQAYAEVMAAIHAHLPPHRSPSTVCYRPQGIKLTPSHFAYLKISEGCDHHCRFCTIPSLRGKLTSRSIGEVLQETEQLVTAGIRELLVISQDTGDYGRNLRYRTDFRNGRLLRTDIETLVQILGELPVWVRLH